MFSIPSCTIARRLLLPLSGHVLHPVMHNRPSIIVAPLRSCSPSRHAQSPVDYCCPSQVMFSIPSCTIARRLLLPLSGHVLHPVMHNRPSIIVHPDGRRRTVCLWIVVDETLAESGRLNFVFPFNCSCSFSLNLESYRYQLCEHILPARFCKFLFRASPAA